MTVRASSAGSRRNGIPLRRYEYRGTGADTLTPPRVMLAWVHQVRALGGEPGSRLAGLLGEPEETEAPQLAGVIALRPWKGDLDQVIGVLAGLLMREGLEEAA